MIKHLKHIILISQLISAAANAQNATAEAKRHIESQIGAGDILQAITMLIVVVALIFSMAWFFRKYIANKQIVMGVIKQRCVMPLGIKDKIVLLEIGDKQLLVAISPGRINTLYVLEEKIPFENDPDHGHIHASSNILKLIRKGILK